MQSIKYWIKRFSKWIHWDEIMSCPMLSCLYCRDIGFQCVHPPCHCKYCKIVQDIQNTIGDEEGINLLINAAGIFKENQGLGDIDR